MKFWIALLMYFKDLKTKHKLKFYWYIFNVTSFICSLVCLILSFIVYYSLDSVYIASILLSPFLFQVFFYKLRFNKHIKMLSEFDYGKIEDEEITSLSRLSTMSGAMIILSNRKNNIMLPDIGINWVIEYDIVYKREKILNNILDE